MLDLIVGLLKNPIMLGAISVALVWFLRKVKWDVGGMKAIWFTYIVALIIAVAEKLLLEGFPFVFSCSSMVSSPGDFSFCVVHTLQNILAWSGVVFALATGIYKILRSKMVLNGRI